MKLVESMNLRPGVTAVIGGGGKTTFLRTAGEELAESHRVLLCTTTKILPFPGLPTGSTLEELQELSRTQSLVCGGVPIPETGKLGPLEIPMADLAACFDYVLVEADGAAGRPLKAHAPHEPVIPQEADQVIAILGASAFGNPIEEVAHRPELYAAMVGAALTAPVTPEMAAWVLRTEQLHTSVFVNQVEEVERLAWTGRLAGGLDCPVVAGSLREGVYFPCK